MRFRLTIHLPIPPDQEIGDAPYSVDLQDEEITEVDIRLDHTRLLEYRFKLRELDTGQNTECGTENLYDLDDDDSVVVEPSVLHEDGWAHLNPLGRAWYPDPEHYCVVDGVMLRFGDRLSTIQSVKIGPITKSSLFDTDYLRLVRACAMLPDDIQARIRHLETSARLPNGMQSAFWLMDYEGSKYLVRVCPHPSNKDLVTVDKEIKMGPETWTDEKGSALLDCLNDAADLRREDEQGGNWRWEVGGRKVLACYFDGVLEDQLGSVDWKNVCPRRRT